MHLAKAISANLTYLFSIKRQYIYTFLGLPTLPTVKCITNASCVKFALFTKIITLPRQHIISHALEAA
jgi:hypothetical protein